MPVETIKSEQLQDKEFKLTSSQALLGFFGVVFLFIFKGEIWVINGRHSGMHFWALCVCMLIFRQKGKSAFMKHYFPSFLPLNIFLIPYGKWPSETAPSGNWWKSWKMGEGEVTCSTAREEHIWLRLVDTSVFWKYYGWAGLRLLKTWETEKNSDVLIPEFEGQRKEG